MFRCDDPTCFNNNPENELMCDKCLETTLEKMSIENLYDMYVETKNLLDNEEEFEELIKTIAPEEAENVNKQSIKEFKESLFDVFNAIMQTKAEVDKNG